MNGCRPRALPPAIESAACCWGIFLQMSKPHILLLQNGQIIISKPHRVSYSCRISELREPLVDINPSNPCLATLHAGTNAEIRFFSSSDCCDFTAQILAAATASVPLSPTLPSSVVAAPPPPPPIAVAAHMGDER